MPDLLASYRRGPRQFFLGLVLDSAHVDAVNVPDGPLIYSARVSIIERLNRVRLPARNSRGGRTSWLRSPAEGLLPANGSPRLKDPGRCPPPRPAYRGARSIRFGRQSQDRHDDWSDDPTINPRPCRRGDRMRGNLLRCSYVSFGSGKDINRSHDRAPWLGSHESGLERKPAGVGAGLASAHDPKRSLTCVPLFAKFGHTDWANDPHWRSQSQATSDDGSR
jgi:hypothetical protein